MSILSPAEILNAEEPLSPGLKSVKELDLAEIMNAEEIDQVVMKEYFVL